MQHDRWHRESDSVPAVMSDSCHWRQQQPEVVFVMLKFVVQGRGDVFEGRRSDAPWLCACSVELWRLMCAPRTPARLGCLRHCEAAESPQCDEACVALCVSLFQLPCGTGR